MGYESPTFIEDVDKLWMQVKPLYDELHRYAMKKLKQRYGDKIDLSDGLIPAHVLGEFKLLGGVNDSTVGLRNLFEYNKIAITLENISFSLPFWRLT